MGDLAVAGGYPRINSASGPRLFLISRALLIVATNSSLVAGRIFTPCSAVTLGYTKIFDPEYKKGLNLLGEVPLTQNLRYARKQKMWTATLSTSSGQAFGVRSSEAQSESKNFFIPSQYFRTTNSVLKCPPRLTIFSNAPVSFANRTLPLYGTCGSSSA